MPDNLVTDIAEFHRATSNGETRYYPANSVEMRTVARDYDAASDPVIIKGFGVYDTGVSSLYAVEVYPTEKQAKAHKPTKPMKAPTSALDGDTTVRSTGAYRDGSPPAPKRRPKGPKPTA
jgi:hypothetical protein